MIIDTETKRKLREMNATDLLDAFERLDEQTTMPLSHTEVIRLAVDSAHSGHMDARIQRLVKRAGLRYPQAEPRGKQSNSTPPPLTKGDSSVQYSSSENQSRHVISCLSSSENHMLTTSLSSYR